MRSEDSEISREDCEEVLETLYRLELEGRAGAVSDLLQAPDLAGRRVPDIIMELALSGHVKVEGARIALTPRGRELGRTIYLRHEHAERLLRSLGLREPHAHEEACRVEHLIDETEVEAARRRLDRIETLLEHGVMRLCDVGPGDYAIVYLSAGRFQRRRLEDMGLVPGERIHVVREQPRGPVEIEVHGARLALGRGVARRILVTAAQPCPGTAAP